MPGVKMRSITGSIVLLTCGLPLLTGCGGLTATGPSAAVQGIGLQGQVHGGQQPISGTVIQLYEANLTGYGLASKPLIGTSILTDSAGNFSLTGSYTCDPGGQVYITASGGNAGAGTNSAIALMAGLGSCSTLAANAATTFISINEVTTVASVNALAGFMGSPTSVATSGTSAGIQGLTNAFASINNLVSIRTGQSLAQTPAGNGAAPQAQINTLANVLAACINSTGAGSAGCTTLFSNAPAGATSPTDTLQAAINIAHSPGAHVAALYGLAVPAGPFQPTNASAPNDWTLSITFTGGGISGPARAAVDASGNIWITNEDSNSVTELDPVGRFISGSSGYTGGGLSAPQNIAIDLLGNAWIIDSGSTLGLTKLSSSGVPSLQSPLIYTSVNYASGVSVDGSGNVWVAASKNNNILKLDSNGNQVTGSPFSGGGINSPSAISIDGSGNVWIVNLGGSNLTKLTNSGAPVSGSPFPSSAPEYIAIDASGNAWITFSSYLVSKLDSSGSVVFSTQGYPTNAFYGDFYSVAIDGSGNAWMANYDVSDLIEISGTGSFLSGFNGYQTGTVSSQGYRETQAAIIDGSGNVWALDRVGGVIEFIGVASPVVTPLALAVKNNTLGTRP